MKKQSKCWSGPFGGFLLGMIWLFSPATVLAENESIRPHFKSEELKREQVGIEVIGGDTFLIEQVTFPDGISVRVLRRETKVSFAPARKDSVGLDVLKGDTNDATDDGWIVVNEPPWSDARFRRNFNCHAYTLHHWFGFSYQDWIDGTASNFSGGENPVRKLLDEYCRFKFQIDVNPLFWDGTLSEDQAEKVAPYDVVAFENSGTRDIIHSGIVIEKNDHLFLKNKEGETALYVVPFATVSRMFLSPNPLERLIWEKIDQISFYSCQADRN